MSIFKKEKQGGIKDVITCEAEDYLIWKWHPNKYEEGTLKRETSIRNGSILKVRTGEVAVFVYKQSSRFFEDYIEGPYEEKLKTKNLPIFSKLFGLKYEGDTPFQAEVFFINTSKAEQIKFGIPYFDVTDPRFPDFQVPVSVRGSITFKIDEYREFVKHNKLATFSLEEFKNKIIDEVVNDIKDVVTKEPKQNNLPVIGIEQHIDAIRNKAETMLRLRLYETYAVRLTGLHLNSIEVDKDSEAYEELKGITKEYVKREREASITDLEQRTAMQRKTDQFEDNLSSIDHHLDAFKAKRTFETGIKMDGGDGSSERREAPRPQDAPRNRRKALYYVEIDGDTTGPFDEETLYDMVEECTILRDTLVWRTGMEDWIRADELDILSPLFPPEIIH